ncbi:MAG: gas vesicle protein K [Armatimonadetes bacterium]|nr:gas vesicle protein K [Armatimonadota bacterium]
MDHTEIVGGEPAATAGLVQALQARVQRSGGGHCEPRRLHLDAERAKNGLAQLVLTLVKLLHELLEREAVRRVEAGGLSDRQIENLGLTLMRQAETLDRLRIEFGLEEEDLNIDLGPIGKLF